MALLDDDLEAVPKRVLDAMARLDDDLRSVSAKALTDPQTVDRMAVLADLQRTAASHRRDIAKAVDQTMRAAGRKGMATDERLYSAARTAGLLEPYAPLAESATIERIAVDGIATATNMANLTATSALNTVSAEFTEALDSALLGIVTGAEAPEAAVAKAVKKIAETETRVSYISESGRRTEAKLYGATRRAILTGANQMTLRMQSARMLEVGATMVEITAHSGARPDHAEWQGSIIPFADLEEVTGYGSGEGLGGWNCGHSFFPYFPEIMLPTDWSWADDSDEAYDLSQDQRNAERNIRKYQARANIYRAAADTEAAKRNAELATKWRGRADEVAAARGGARRKSREVGRLSEA